MSALAKIVSCLAPLGAVALVAAACSAPANPNLGVVTPTSDDTNWHPVNDLLDLRCGTLDCHGNAQRNLVIYGCNGLRLDTTDAGLVSRCARQGGSNTVPDEYNATFRSLVGLEPSVMSYVVQHKGGDPDLLTFMRKARGEENHKGNQLFTPGDDQDQCVVSWLTGTTDTDACARAIKAAANVGVAPAPDAGSAP